MERSGRGEVGDKQAKGGYDFQRDRISLFDLADKFLCNEMATGSEEADREINSSPI